MTTEANGEGPVLYRATRRVSLRDTDASGLIHYAVAPDWTEDFFTEWLVAIGHPISKMLASDYAVPIVRVEADYHAPIGVDDVLELRLSVAHIGEKSFSLWVRAYDTAGKCVLQVRPFHVYTLFDKNPDTPTPRSRSAPLPKWLRTALTIPVRR